MEQEKLTLTQTDNYAVSLGDSNYLLNKGADLYRAENFKDAVEYYRIAAAMGNIHAISNLGYCYLYGRDIEANLSLALSYFNIAALHEDIDAAYKLGDIYGSNKWGFNDKELSVYYYRMAATHIIGNDWEDDSAIIGAYELRFYPSLCFALGRELFPGGAMCTNIEVAYQFLKQAEIGYKLEIDNGSKMYSESYENVLRLLSDAAFDDIRKKYDDIFDGLFLEDDISCSF